MKANNFRLNRLMGSPRCVYDGCRRMACRPCGLCEMCYGVRDIRERYPCETSEVSCRKKPPAHFNLLDARPLPPEPTQEMPGTKEKIKVLEQRASMGFVLFHPDDAKWSDLTMGLLELLCR